MTSAHWIGAVLIAVLLAVGLSTRDYSAATFWLGGGVLLYFCLLKIAPAAARIWLCMGGALVGAFLCVTPWFSLIFQFRDGWNIFGLVIWSGLALMVVGGVAGFWAVHRWTEPRGPRNRLAE